MKKTFLLLAVVCCIVMNAWSASYPLYVGGTQVTDAIKDTITGSKGTSRVSYNPTTNTLTLKDAVIFTVNQKPIESSIAGLKIVCNGSNTICYSGSDASMDALTLNANTTITTEQANSSLTIISKDAAISMGECNVVVDGNNFSLSLDIRGKNYGFWGVISGKGGSGLTIKDANVNIDATSKGAICNLQSLTLTNVEVNSPAGCAFSTTSHALTKSGSVVKDTVSIRKAIEKYGIYIKGNQVTSENCNDILDDGGTVKYDDATKTLTLSNATIEHTEDVIAIYSDVTFKCIGSNTIYCTTNYNAIYADTGSPTFVGSGELTLISNQGTAMSIYCETLTVDGTTLLAKGNGKYATINGCNKLIMQNSVSLLSNTTFDNMLHQFIDRETGLESKADISFGKMVTYELYIDGTQVTSTNCGDVLGNGTVKYDTAAHQLNLYTASIASSSHSAIKSGLPNLTIRHYGISTIAYTGSSTTQYAIEGKNISIVKGGTKLSSPELTVESTSSTAIKCDTLGMKANLTVNGNSTTPTIQCTAFSLSDCLIMSAHTYKEGMFVDADGNQATDTIVFKWLTDYGFSVAGISVTNIIANDILDDGGSVKYDEASKTLTLNNAAITYDGAKVIDLSTAIKIECIGNNTIQNTNATSGIGIAISKGIITFNGPGSLLVKSDAEVGIFSQEEELQVFNGCVLTVQSAHGNAIMLNWKNIGVDNATLIAKGNDEKATITGCNDLYMTNGVAIRSAHTWDAENSKFLSTATGEEAKDEILIGLEGAGIEQVKGDRLQVTGDRKIMKNGQLLIIRNNKIFNLNGQEL